MTRLTRMPASAPRCVSASAMSEAPSRARDIAVQLASLPSDVVDGGEIVILAIKPAVWRPFIESGGWIIGACAAAMAIGAFEVAPAGLSQRTAIQLVLLVGLARLGVAILKWIPTWYVLTNRRVMTISGIRMPRVSSMLLVDIRNTYLNRSLAERWAALGTITCMSGEEPCVPQVWQCVADCQAVHEQIRHAVDQAIDGQSGGW